MLQCGHPCEKSNVHLRDEQGKDHLVLADMGCRNTVFNAAAQSGVLLGLDLGVEVSVEAGVDVGGVVLCERMEL